MQWNEDTFLRRLNAKDERAYEELFRAYYRALVRFSFDYVKVWEDAEDVVQRVLVALWEGRAAFATGNALRNFFYNGVRNASLNCPKHRAAEANALSSLEAESADDDDLDEKVMREELYRLLYEAIDELPERCREVFLLHLKGKGNREIAEALGLSVLTVKTQKNRALQFLRERFGVFLLFFNLLFPNCF